MGDTATTSRATTPKPVQRKRQPEPDWALLDAIAAAESEVP